MNQRKIFLSCIVLSFLFVSSFVYYFFMNKRDIEQVSVSAETPFSKLVSDYHDFYNREICYNGYKTIRWNDIKVHIATADESVSGQLESIEDDLLREDMKRIEQLYEITLQTKDREALIYVHRVFHDLDVLINDYPEDIYGVTAYQAGQNTAELLGYIDLKKK